MYDFFLSYRRDSSSEFCSFLYEKLSSQGSKVFFDWKSLRAGAFDEQIDRALSESSFILLILSSKEDLKKCKSNPNEDWIIHEISIAQELGKTVIPVIIKEKFKFPKTKWIKDTKVRTCLEFINRQQAVNLFGPEAAQLAKSKIYEKIGENPATKLRQDFYKGILDKQYSEWELRTLKNIYSDLTFVREFGKDFPSIAVEGSPEIKYPFNDLTPQENLDLTLRKQFITTEDANANKIIDDFKTIIGPNVHFPELYGFTNTEIIFDKEKVQSFKAKPRTYFETVLSSHILHYELWKTYDSLNKESEPRIGTLDDLPIRKQIHNNLSNKEVLFSGCGRSSLVDICISVLIYDKRENDYAIALAKRSEKVACYPGYSSIIPSGGFELYELEKNQTSDRIKKNFSVLPTLYREYVEELFGDEHFNEPTGNDDLRRLYRSQHIKDLENGIQNGTISFEFLGMVFDIIPLRPTLAFVLRIDDPQYLYDNDFLKNYENYDLRFTLLRDFEKEIKEMENDAPLLTESAAAYSLLKKNHLYTEALEKTKE